MITDTRRLEIKHEYTANEKLIATMVTVIYETTEDDRVIESKIISRTLEGDVPDDLKERVRQSGQYIEAELLWEIQRAVTQSASEAK